MISRTWSGWRTNHTAKTLRISPPKPPDTARADPGPFVLPSHERCWRANSTPRDSMGPGGLRGGSIHLRIVIHAMCIIYIYTIHSFIYIYTKLWWRVVKWQIKKWRLWNGDLFPVQSHLFLLKMIQGFLSSKKSIYSDRTMGWTSKRGCALPFFPQDAGKNTVYWNCTLGDVHFIDCGENAKPHDMCFRNKKDIMFFAASFVGARFCAEL